MLVESALAFADPPERFPFAPVLSRGFSQGVGEERDSVSKSVGGAEKKQKLNLFFIKFVCLLLLFTHSSITK